MTESSQARPGAQDPEAVRQEIRALEASGKTLEAIRLLTAYRATGDAQDMTEELRTLKLRGFAQFNAHRDVGELRQAEQYASALAGLMPDHLGIVEAAFDCNRMLGDFAKATDFAITLLNLHDRHPRALDFVSALRRFPDTAELEIVRRMAMAAPPRHGKEELYRLRDVGAAIGAILCTTLDDTAIARLQSLFERAAGIKTPFPASSRGGQWERFYRSKMQAVDLPAVLTPVLDDAPDLPVDFCTADGRRLDWQGVQAVARDIGARAVFFAAADMHYVARYANWYVRTILAACDVPCLIMVHIIGGADRLADTAASLGISDPRLIFAGDRFDAAAVTTKVIVSPAEDQPMVPVAHYQSVRFIRLGAILKHLWLPVLVSDIDTLLQRGVADLLAAHEGAADVVFNENAHALSQADRLTANLLLVYPTPNAALFARFLRGYLERHLQRPEVSRWVDQIGLLLARHYLRRLNGARIGAFDTQTDINNIMYAKYAPNPYRFLSLYQGFDLESLRHLISG